MHGQGATTKMHLAVKEFGESGSEESQTVNEVDGVTPANQRCFRLTGEKATDKQRRAAGTHNTGRP